MPTWPASTIRWRSCGSPSSRISSETISSSPAELPPPGNQRCRGSQLASMSLSVWPVSVFVTALSHLPPGRQGRQSLLPRSFPAKREDLSQRVGAAPSQHPPKSADHERRGATWLVVLVRAAVPGDCDLLGRAGGRLAGLGQH